MIQKKEDIDKWHVKNDPWGYHHNKSDKIRKEILLSEIPLRSYTNVLDIGCGQGFITRDLPGERVYGVDISEKAIEHANLIDKGNVIFIQGSIFEMDKLFNVKFDLIIITGVLYKQYIGKSCNLIYLLIDKILNRGGVLISVHIDEWYSIQFPYFKLSQQYYEYREYTHNLEVYLK